jgi:hypothetical protein
VVLGAHQLAMHYSFARIRKTVIFYHVLIPEFEDDRYTILEVSIGKKSK